MLAGIAKLVENVIVPVPAPIDTAPAPPTLTDPLKRTMLAVSPAAMPETAESGSCTWVTVIGTGVVFWT